MPKHIWIGQTYAVLSLIYDVYYYEMRKEAFVLTTRDKCIVLIFVIIDVGILILCGIKAVKTWKETIMKTKRARIIRFIIIIAVAFAAAFILVRLYHNEQREKLKYSQEYVPGTGNIKGDVDTARFTEISDAFAVGANSYGYAVFKDPEAALTEMKSRYADGISLIQNEFELAPLSQSNYESYEEYGWQATSGDQEERDEATFVSEFLDIYENSFKKQ